METKQKNLDDAIKLLNDEKEARKNDAIETQRATAKNRLSKVMPEGLTERQKVFINGTFDPSKLEDLSDEGLINYIEKSKDEFKKYAAVFGVEDSSSSTTANTGDSVVTEDKTDAENILDDILSGND